MEAAPQLPERLEVTFDLDTLTIGDFEVIEEATGKDVFEVIKQVQAKKDFSPDAALLKALVTIALRKVDERFTLADGARFPLARIAQPAAAPSSKKKDKEKTTSGPRAAAARGGSQ